MPGNGFQVSPGGGHVCQEIKILYFLTVARRLYEREKKYSTMCLWIFLELFVRIKKNFFLDNDHFFLKQIISVFFSFNPKVRIVYMYEYIKTINVYIKTINVSLLFVKK